ncbi:MAG: porin family protein [bacterium]|nr:porin family protein [bacterium]
MRATLVRVLLSLAIFVVAFSPALASGRGYLFGGNKTMDDEIVADGHSEFGAMLSIGQSHWPVMIAIDLLWSSGDSDGFLANNPTLFSVDAESQEFNVGFRKFWGDRWQPYVGAGAAMIKVSADIQPADSSFALSTDNNLMRRGVTPISDSDTGLGLFANAGLSVRLGRRFHLGVDARYTAASTEAFEIFGLSGWDAGGTHFGLVAGFSW